MFGVLTCCVLHSVACPRLVILVNTWVYVCMYVPSHHQALGSGDVRMTNGGHQRSKHKVHATAAVSYLCVCTDPPGLPRFSFLAPLVH